MDKLGFEPGFLWLGTIGLTKRAIWTTDSNVQYVTIYFKLLFE